MQLNPAQSEAVNYTSGPCLVLAGAGSGKTRVITEKIVKLYKNYSIPPERICALTFTNKAANEMRERAGRELPPEVAARLWISTFHSLGLEILHIDHQSFNLGRTFTLFDEQDIKKALRDIVRSDFQVLLRNESESEIIDAAQNAISLWKGRLCAPEEISQADINLEIYRSYQRFLQACNAVDFDDLIFLPARALQRQAHLREKWAQCFSYVLVDEYQDTNETQYQLLKYLTAGSRRFTVVGDDDQSIYSWRGARPENIKTLLEDYPDLRVIKLEQNYRSSRRILRCANNLIANNPHLFAKSLFSDLDEGMKLQVYQCEDENHEAALVAATIAGIRFDLGAGKSRLSDFAVLYRSNFQSRFIEKALGQAGIPCRVTGGTSFYALAEVKDIMAWSRTIANPQDDSALLRIINVPRRGIGTDTLQKITDNARANHQSIFDCIMSGRVDAKLNTEQRSALADFIIICTRLRSYILSRRDAELAQNLPDLIGYPAYLNRPRENKAAINARLENVRIFCSWLTELIRGRRGEAPLSFARAVDKLTMREMLERRREDGEEEEDAVQLMTLHSSKGLEFPYVFMVGMEENILPHKSSLDAGGPQVEEERRLAYVGITRAQVFLALTYCRQRRVHGALAFPRPSRFLSELPQEELQRHLSGQPVRLTYSLHNKQRNLDQALDQLKDLL